MILVLSLKKFSENHSQNYDYFTYCGKKCKREHHGHGLQSCYGTLTNMKFVHS